MTSESSSRTINSLSLSSSSHTTATTTTTYEEVDTSYYSSLCSKFGIRFILMNDSHGGFSFNESEEFTKEIYRRFPNDRTIMQDLQSCRYLFGTDGLRSDPIMLEMFDEMGSNFCSGRCCVLEKAVIPVGFDRWVRCKEYDGKESIHVDYDKAYVEQIHDVLDQQDMNDTNIVESLRALRENMDNIRCNWQTDAKKKMGDALLPIIKSRLYETGRGVGNEVWNMLSSLDIPDAVRLLQNPQQFDSVLIQNVTKEFDAVAMRITDMIVASESISSLFTIIWHDTKSKMITPAAATATVDNYYSRKVKRLLDEAIELGEIAIDVSARSYYSRDFCETIVEKRIRPVVESYNVTSSITDKLLSAVKHKREWRGNPAELYKLSDQKIDRLELFLSNLLDPVVSEMLRDADWFHRPILTRRCTKFGYRRYGYRPPSKRRKLNKSFFSRFAEDG